MTSKHLKRALVLTAAAALACCVGVPALAQKKFLERVRRQYLLGPEAGKCTLCHKIGKNEEPGKDNLNVFGKAIQAEPAAKPAMGKGDEHKFTEEELAAILKAVENIGDKDSDGDGATNKEELELGTFPGDPASKPDAKKLEEYRAKQKK